MSNTLNDLRFQLKRKAQLAARRMDEAGTADLRRTGPVDTGDLSRATSVTHTQSRNRIVWTIEVDVPYAEAQAKGARPHRIPTSGTAKPTLRFFWGKKGKVVYFPYVNHPGNPANPWWDNWLRAASRRLQRIWDSV
jgi:hypothetical protein